jgi:hypothetical protein
VNSNITVTEVQNHDWGGTLVAVLRFSASEPGSARFRVPDGVTLHDNGWNASFSQSGNVITVTADRPETGIGIHVTRTREMSTADVVPVT